MKSHSKIKNGIREPFFFLCVYECKHNSIEWISRFILMAKKTKKNNGRIFHLKMHVNLISSLSDVKTSFFFSSWTMFIVFLFFFCRSIAMCCYWDFNRIPRWFFIVYDFWYMPWHGQPIDVLFTLSQFVCVFFLLCFALKQNAATINANNNSTENEKCRARKREGKDNDTTVSFFLYINLIASKM